MESIKSNIYTSKNYNTDTFELDYIPPNLYFKLNYITEKQKKPLRLYN